MNHFPKTKSQWVRFWILVGVAFLAWGYNFGLAWVGYMLYQPQPGDVVFQPLPHCELTEAIEGCTHSLYSHCGMVYREDGKWMVVESIQEVRTTSLYRWIRRGRQARFAVYRLRPKYQANVDDVLKATFSYLGRPYDFKYAMDDEEIYCSELIYKAFRTVTGEEMGELVKLGDLDWQPHKETLRELEGGDPPLDRAMITPRDLAKAPQLTRVFGFWLE